MGNIPSVSLDPGCEEVLDMPVSAGNIKGKPDRVVDAKEDLDFRGLAHDLAHVLEIIEGEERACLDRGERYQLVFRELAPDVIGVPFGNEIECLVFRVDPKGNLVRDHGRRLHRVVEILPLDHDLAREIDGRRVRVLPYG